MKFLFSLFFCISISLANNEYCTLSDENKQLSSSRQFYNVGDIISEEDQSYAYTVCHSDGNYETDSFFQFSDYSGDIILISMNATW